jgi:uncharacterized protein (DUF2461 family)
MSSHATLPLPPLLHAYVVRRPSLGELGRLPHLGPRFSAVLGASARFLYGDFLDHAKNDDFRDAITRFYEACVTPPLHVETLRRRAGLVRFALGHLLRGRDALPQKADALLAANGPYHVAGLGPAFWSALLQGLDPKTNPAWTPAALAGLRRLGLADWSPGDGPAAVYASLQRAYRRVQALDPAMTALHVEHFLTLAGAMRGRNLWQASPDLDAAARAVQQERARVPVRDRLKKRGEALALAQEKLEAALQSADGKAIGDALAAADPEGAARSPLDWGAQATALTHWAGRLWQSDDPYAELSEFWRADPLPGAGLWLPAAVLHLRDPQQFHPWNEALRRGHARLDDGDDGDAAERYRLFNEGAEWLRVRHQLHPLETPAVLEALGEADESAAPESFGGFCADTFHFLAELAENNRREWMERQRGRYRFAVREPLAELCRALARRYVEPVLGGVHAWQLDTAPRNGRALTSICRNGYGRGEPYNTRLWVVFCARNDGRRDGAQFFVRLDATGLSYGVRLGRGSRDRLRRFRRQLDMHADTLFAHLRDNGALAACRFALADSPENVHDIAGGCDLRQWAANRSLEVAMHVPAGSPLLESEELVGDILLTFDRLAALYACATDDSFTTITSPARDGYTESDFLRATYLGPDWLRQARGLLDLKRQLILQGVPGTGKTHVARALARLLTGGRHDAVRLVQFHPAYSYEEFVEGIKVRSVEVDGRHDVTYPVEDGLLCAFAAEAARQPALPFVLVIDEINRGNLPRIFGELLYLLEYREQAVELPCSRRRFRLPANLHVIGTMNAADRSVALLDQALRRRFSFLEMPPDARVLASWLEAQTPPLDPAFAKRVLLLFERLNERLRADLGAQAQVGHSYFMAPGLDEARLRVVWQHHVKPLLDEHFAAHPGRTAGYDLDRLLDPDARRASRRKQPTGV